MTDVRAFPPRIGKQSLCHAACCTKWIVFIDQTDSWPLRGCDENIEKVCAYDRMIERKGGMVNLNDPASPVRWGVISQEAIVTVFEARGDKAYVDGFWLYKTKGDAKVAGTITGIPVIKAIRRGVSFVEIVEYVRIGGIDLVIMATHGKGGLNLIIGSAVEKVVRKSPCPVLTIRPAKKQVKVTS